MISFHAGNMLIAADCHVHFYPCYDLAAALENAVANLNRLLQSARSRAVASRPDSGSAVRLLMLAERHDCHFFRALADGSQGLPPGYSVSSCSEDGALLILTPREEKLFFVAGRQIATRERLEVLALSIDAAPPDGTPVEEVMAAVRHSGGIPAVNWAPGKWMFGRGALLRKLIEGSKELVLCDTSLRPALWPEPDLMCFARARNMKIIAGSDPFPFRGEERGIGRYGMLCRFPFDESHPVTSLRTLLRDSGVAATLGGSRRGLLSVVRAVGRLKLGANPWKQKGQSRHDP